MPPRTRSRNPSDTLMYLLVGVGVFFVAKAVFGGSASAPVDGLPPGSQPPSTEPPVLPPTAPPPPNTTPSGPLALTVDWPNERVLVIGDSLGVGVQPRLRDAMRNRGVAAFSGISVGGKNIAQWSDNVYPEGKALEAALADFRPTLVLISLGTNDESIRKYHGDPRYWTQENLAKNLVGPNFDVAKQRRRAIERLARKLSGVKSVWLGPPASPSAKWPMDRGFRDLLAQTWEGRYFNTEAVAPQKSGDGIHFTGSGYQKWADAIMDYLDRK